MSDYTAYRPSGGLKFKGDDGKRKKKKKSHSTSSLATEGASIEAKREHSAKKETTKDRDIREHSRDRDSRRSSAGPPSASGSPAPLSGSGPKKTAAELRYEEVQRQRREERARKTAHQTHKDRLNDYNSKLERLSEHHDMPRIGPG